MSREAGAWLLSKHRIEALTDGIYAVAMTLLVLELKLPEGAGAAGEAEFARALQELAPKFIAWVFSFLILALFWLSHQRLFHFVRHVDATLAQMNVVALLFASLLPFSSALLGEHQAHFASHVFYDLNMAALALAALAQVRYLARHPGLCEPPIPAPVARGAQRRAWILAGVALASIAVAAWNPRWGTAPFILMIFLARTASREASGPAATTPEKPSP